jgi:hypothetical protein
MRLVESAHNGKIIAYHGTGRKITQFSDPYMAGHFFTQDKEYAKAYAGGKTSLSLIDKPKKTRNYLLTVELDIKHMFDTKTDSEAREYYNTQFLQRINALAAKFNQPPRPVLEPDKYVSFIEADDLFRYFMSFKSIYDGMLVDEGGISSHPAIVAFYGSQIKILKQEIIKFDDPSAPTGV